MTEMDIISKMTDYLHKATSSLSEWLEDKLPKLTKDWWEQCVLHVLNESQLERVTGKNPSLSSLDLASLLTVADRNWYNLRDHFRLNAQDRKSITDIRSARNNWAHCGSTLPGKEAVERDLELFYRFFECLGSGYGILGDISKFQSAIRKTDFTDIDPSNVMQAAESSNLLQECMAKPIQIGDIVFLRSTSQEKGVVISVEIIGVTRRYKVFINGRTQSFYEGQVAAVPQDDSQKISVLSAKNYLTAYQVLNPSRNSLYSLNSARIDFEPYQFRPALKIIKSDQPRLLIADSVGVGKTIEAGLVMKELQARSEAESVLVICPKPLVSERKWELEMKRFDEDFTQLDSNAFRRAISDTDRDGIWPEKHSKTIIPYSLFTKEILYGGTKSSRRHISGLLDLDTPPHFDLVVVDEAHHIRNRETYAYAGVEFFCRNADAVVLLTATPIQTGDDDLYTLLNLLRPDMVTDPDTFQLMARPNPYINLAVRAARTASEHWQQEALEALGEACHTQWGSHVICKDLRYQSALQVLTQTEISQKERVNLISDLEGLHSFSSMINRTRRQDIQDFCVRRCHTIETTFTERQRMLHDGVLQFEAKALSALHGNQNVTFMLGTIRRQVASCVFGLAPFLRNLLDRRINQITEDAELDFEHTLCEDPEILCSLKPLADELLKKAENLPEEDPKFDAMLEVIVEKQSAENNKTIIFSSFKHTLAYLKGKLKAYGLRVAQVDGSVKDEDRLALRERFQMDREDPEALDILLFTEVGCEGLDYQFCDMMINYDLPWNPMRIEQRIGRIDRRGQKSEVVNIYNMITADTIDADIYHRCLLRIGVFEGSIGECSEILGKVAKSIQDISLNFTLTEEERRSKLAQMSDNEIRKAQELQRLEDEQRQLFSLDLSGFSMNQDIQDAEDPWLAPPLVLNMVQSYLDDKLGKGTYIQGEGPVKNLRLSEVNRSKLLEDYRELPLKKTPIHREWERYLKGTDPNVKITFDSECAEQNRATLFITTSHPLVWQSARTFSGEKDSLYLTVEAACACQNLPAGKYPFAIYQWEYRGFQSQHTLKVVCRNAFLQEELMDLLQTAQDSTADIPPEKTWDDLENLHYQLWQEEQKAHKERAEANRDSKLESLTYCFENQKRALQTKIQEAADERILRMYKAQLSNHEHNYAEKRKELDLKIEETDILANVFMRGVFVVK